MNCRTPRIDQAVGDEQRDRVIARICGLSTEQLHRVESFLAHLECGDSSPLFGEGVRPASDAPRHAAAVVAGVESGNELPHSRDWPHAPIHRLSEHGTYIVTAGTYRKEHWFRGPDRLDLLESALLRTMRNSGWRLEAWAAFSNHYHFVAHAGPGATPLRAAIKQLHGETSREVNRRDGTAGRGVWHNFWDTELTFEKSYLARLNYVHQNAVKHGLAAVACQYRWCSAAWFERTATRAQVGTIYRFRIDKLNVHDDYEPI
jgi:putative transposase